MRSVRSVSVAGVLALLGLLVWDVAHSSGGGIAAKVDKGQTVTAPAVNLPRIGGGAFDLASYRGKVVVVNFWASWCPDCKLEAKTLANGATNWAKKNSKVVFVGVDTNDLSSAAKSWLARYGVGYGIARDVSGSESDRWGVTGYPETFFVDPTGHVVPPHIIGPISKTQLNSAIESALRS